MPEHAPPGRAESGRAASGMLVAGAAVLLAGAAWWLLGGSSGSGETTAPSTLTAPHTGEQRPGFKAPARDAQAIDPAPAPAADIAAADAAAGALTADNAARAVLIGRVTHADDGTPAPGVELMALVDIDGQRTKPPLDAEGSQPVTDADGRYRLAYTQPCTVTQLRASPGPDTPRGQRDAQLVLTLSAEATLDLALGRGGALSGLVVDDRGQPVPGATVTGFTDNATMLFENRYEPDRTTTADGSGAFVLEGLGPPFVITAGAPGFRAREELVGTLAEGVRLGARAGGSPIDPPLTVVLSPVREIRGQVLGADGTPVVRAHIVCSVPEPSAQERLTAVPGVFHRRWSLPERRTDNDGRFLLKPLCSEPCTVNVFAEGHASWSGTHAPGDPDLLIRLGKGVVLTGSVTEAGTGKPLQSFVQVFALDRERARSVSQGAMSDSDGRFTVAGLPPTTSAELNVQAPGHAILVHAPQTLTEAGPNHLDLVLEPESALAGVVVDVSGAPVPGAYVTIAGDRFTAGLDEGPPLSTWESRFGLDGALADGEGRFSFRQLYAGSFTLVATHPREAGLTGTLTALSGSEDLRLVLDPASSATVTLVGTATDALTGRPIPHFEVTVLVAEARGLTGESHTFDDEAGAYRIAGLPPGELQLLAVAPGYAMQIIPLALYEAGEQRVDLVLTSARSVTFRVLDEHREPVAARLSFMSGVGSGAKSGAGAGNAGQSLMVESGQGGQQAMLRCNAKGEAIVHGLPAELITVTASRNFRSEAQEFPVDLRSEPRGPIELVLSPPEELTLTWVVMCSAPGMAVPSGEAELKAFSAGLGEQFAQGALWALDADGLLRATTADGSVKAESRLDASVPAEALEVTHHLAPGATRPIFGSLQVPNAPLTISVTAAGYVPASLPWDPAVNGLSDTPLIFLLHRQ